MQSPVLATVGVSVRQSICLSVCHTLAPIDPHYQHQKCRPTTLVSGDTRVMRIFAEVPWGGASNDSGVVENSNFQRFRWLFFRKLQR